MSFPPDWPPSAIATFAAAGFAAVVALVSAAVTIVDGAVTRKRNTRHIGRDQWWTRWSFTIERAFSDDPVDRQIGALLIRVLVEIPTIPQHDERMAKAIAEAIAEPARTGPTDPPLNKEGTDVPPP